jgi:hypothetical protein
MQRLNRATTNRRRLFRLLAPLGQTCLLLLFLKATVLSAAFKQYSRLKPMRSRSWGCAPSSTLREEPRAGNHSVCATGDQGREESQHSGSLYPGGERLRFRSEPNSCRGTRAIRQTVQAAHLSALRKYSRRRTWNVLLASHKRLGTRGYVLSRCRDGEVRAVS